MNLDEFITYCKLSGYVHRDGMVIGVNTQKIMIENALAQAFLIYNTKEYTIERCSLIVFPPGAKCYEKHNDVSVADLTKAFFPS